MNLFDFNVQPNTHGDGGRRIQNIVCARHVEEKFPQVLPAIQNMKTAGGLAFAGIERGATQFDLEVGTASRAIGDGAAADNLQHAAQHGIVIANHYHAVERNAIHEVEEGAFHIAHVAIAVHVFAVNVGDDRKDRRKLKE